MPEAITSPVELNLPYTNVELTDEINLIPNTYGMLNERGVMPFDPVSTKMVEVKFSEGEIIILDDAERESNDGSVAGESGEQSFFFKIPYLPHFVTVRPGAVQDKYELRDGRRVPKTMDSVLSGKMIELRDKFAITLEYMRMQSLKGRLVNGSGQLIYDWYQQFGVTKKTIDLKLGSSNTDVLAKFDELNDHMEQNLMGETMDGVHVPCARTLFQKLISHPKIEKFYLGYQERFTTKQERNRFEINGITFEVYNAVAPNTKREPVKFIESGKGHAYPTGTRNTFKTYLGPANHEDMVNTDGVEIFVSQKKLDHGMGTELKGQSCPLPICKRPKLLVELFSST